MVLKQVTVNLHWPYFAFIIIILLTVLFNHKYCVSHIPLCCNTSHTCSSSIHTIQPLWVVQLFTYIFYLFFYFLALITYFKCWTNLTIALTAQKEIFFWTIHQEQTMRYWQKYQNSANVPVFHRMPKKTKQNPQRKLQTSSIWVLKSTGWAPTSKILTHNNPSVLPMIVGWFQLR